MFLFSYGVKNVRQFIVFSAFISQLKCHSIGEAFPNHPNQPLQSLSHHLFHILFILLTEIFFFLTHVFSVFLCSTVCSVRSNPMFMKCPYSCILAIPISFFFKDIFHFDGQKLVFLEILFFFSSLVRVNCFQMFIAYVFYEILACALGLSVLFFIIYLF